MLSLTVKKVDVFKFDGVAESDNTSSQGSSIANLNERLATTFSCSSLLILSSYVGNNYPHKCNVRVEPSGLQVENTTSKT